ncbi:homoserine dehydrogenase [Devriesea agamarum]|uniref:homoserine dehydrogenase n=1 Tax=Devriesea agamarum TaxID=472569 RepID=UPI000A038486|nr:homoserine dehydrogenase [Devriesea agamarum]
MSVDSASSHSRLVRGGQPGAQTKPVTLAILGAGTVGTEVLRLLDIQRDDLAQRVGAPLEVIGIAVQSLHAPRAAHVNRKLLTDQPQSLVRTADIVVEMMGGLHPAGDLLESALESGASVVTANKALLAADGPRLYEAADRHGADIYFEAAVAGAIPLVRPIRESLAGDRVRRVLGIVNGTTNYILDAMTRHGQDFQEALGRAQELGYAEADPTADVDGDDAASKAAILASLAFHSRVRLDDVHCEGIRSINVDDIAAARRLGMVIKLLCIVERVDDDQHGERIAARVYPAMLPLAHPLSSVGGAYNAVFVEAEAAGSLMFYGQGAGGSPTASAVLGDIVSVARHRVQGGKGPNESRYADLPVAPVGELESGFYIALDVLDQPGVLAAVAGTLSGHGISIRTIHQEVNSESGHARVELVTYRAREDALNSALESLRADAHVVCISSMLRVEGE